MLVSLKESRKKEPEGPADRHSRIYSRKRSWEGNWYAQKVDSLSRGIACQDFAWMGTHMSRACRSVDTSPKIESQLSTSSNSSSTGVPDQNPQKKGKGNFRRHNTVAQIHGSETSASTIQSTLFRHASYGDFRHHIQDDLKSVSKRFTQVLGRAESLLSVRDDKEAVKYKHDFRTKYDCNFTAPLSHGRYATVTAAESFLTAQNVAVKIISKDRLYDKKSGKRCAGENVRIEVLALRNLADQPNVVKFFDVYEDEAFFYVVMELCKGGNLLERINRAGPMKEAQAVPLFKQMLSVMEICHSHGICHRDLKLENFVFLSDTEDSTLNLVDFGSAAFFKSGDKHPFKGVVGTFNYMAPEVYDSSYGPSADMWSLGIICYALLCSFLPFTASTNEELRNKIKNEEIAFPQSNWEGVSESAKDLLKKMLEKNPDARITIAKAKCHPWIKQFDVKANADCCNGA